MPLSHSWWLTAGSKILIDGKECSRGHASESAVRASSLWLTSRYLLVPVCCIQDTCLGLALDLRTAAAAVAAAGPPAGCTAAHNAPAVSSSSTAAGITSNSSSSKAPATAPSAQNSSGCSSSGASGTAWVDLAHLKNIIPPHEAAHSSS
jgi:hypothetical protein